MLQYKEQLQNSKNLLAFSAGGDSTALLFLLLEHNIPFDIAIVNYQTRHESQAEVSYAQALAKQYNVRCHLLNATKITKNFEAQAREIRYNFFEELITKNSYQNLLTAHHLGDRFEWMLMQFCRGAGCVELAGMQSIDKRQDYTLIRPLLHLEKKELLAYLHKKNILYFEDKSNLDESYKRNEFRHNYTKPLLEKYLQGIKSSFRYIDEDCQLLQEESEILKCNELHYFESSTSILKDVRTIDRYFKSHNHLITKQERELLKEQYTLIIGRKFVVYIVKNYIFIAPYIKVTAMKKEFKEKMRKLSIEPKLRGYLATDPEAVLLISRLLQ